jgi:hypothetical protein
VTVDGATGAVGVGAATPLAPVVAKTTVTASSDKIVYGMTQSDNNAGRIVGMGIAATGSVANQGINFYTCLSSVQSERLRINEQGNVGINTTTPSTLLEVKADSNSTTDYPITVLNSAESVTTGYGAYGIDQSASSAYTIDVHDDLVIKSNTGENLRILENGGITFNGDTAAANALDDYEEGTFTPILSDAITGGNVSSSTFTGYYTKIGNLVHCRMAMFNINTTGMTAGNNLYMQGLPFTVAAGAINLGSCFLDRINFSGFVVSQAPANYSYILFNNMIDSASEGILKVSSITASTGSDISTSITFNAV